jgi:hypothetical protein
MNHISSSPVKFQRRGELILAVYQDRRRVFCLQDIALLAGETRFVSLNQKLNYSVRTGKLLNPRRGIYAKPDFQVEELACKIYRPSYISLEYVLQKAGVIFQYDSRITLVSLLSREIQQEGRILAYHKIKGEILIQTQGIDMGHTVSMASPERAFLDMLYLKPDTYFDRPGELNPEIIGDLLPIYRSKALAARVKRILKRD